jgi:hypothetical protein
MMVSEHSLEVLSRLDEYDPRWSGVGGSDRASVPLGNGELCANVWVQSDGVHLYLSRSDALSEFDRTLKLGEYVLSLSPNPFEHSSGVTQTLELRSGVFRVRCDGRSLVEIDVFVDADDDAAVIRVRSEEPLTAFVESRTWRTGANDLAATAGTIWGDEDRSLGPELDAVTESADVLETLDEGILLYHRNSGSIVPGIANMHGLGDALDVIPDLISGRIFGSFVSVRGPATPRGHGVGVEAQTSIDVRIATFSSQDRPLADLVRRASSSQWDPAESQRRTARYWSRYWTRSWVFITGDPRLDPNVTAEVRTFAAANALPVSATFTGSPITRAYVLTKWLTACSVRGAMPMLYNGGLFTTMPGAGTHVTLDSFAKAFTSQPAAAPDLELNPDERSWTTEHLWQNLRLPYYSLLARGEPEALVPLFAYFRRFWDLNRKRARRQHGALGQWSTEMTLSCGLQSPMIYGLDRTGLREGETRNRWGGAIDVSPGLELCKLMFDYWRFTGNDAFLADEVLPYAGDLLDFARSRYHRSDPERLEFGPLNSLETYFDTVNPVAVVAGYHRLVDDLSSVPDALLGRRAAVKEFSALLPDIPIELDAAGRTSIAPAEQYEPTRMNVESPELYTLFPFDLRSQLSEDLMEATWAKCLDVSGAFRPATIGEPLGLPSFSGWQTLAPAAVLLGKVDEALQALQENSALSNPGFSFPAMWGPVYDSVPDSDHGSNILNTVQLLVSEAISREDVRRKIPATWTIDFRVFSSTGQPVTGRIQHGELRLSDSDPDPAAGGRARGGA